LRLLFPGLSTKPSFSVQTVFPAPIKKDTDDLKPRLTVFYH